MNGYDPIVHAAEAVSRAGYGERGEEIFSLGEAALARAEGAILQTIAGRITHARTVAEQEALDAIAEARPTDRCGPPDMS